MDRRSGYFARHPRLAARAGQSDTARSQPVSPQFAGEHRLRPLDADMAEIAEAARLAHADAFIDAMPQGYESLVGERGVKLSGGQRQRIAIARVMLKDAPILILDEATSSLDSVTEKTIQENLDRVMGRKTVIAIAHRLSTIAHLDRILVFDQGRIVEDGSHQELLDKQGFYYRLWTMQAGGFLPEEVA
nr:ATP-binding cassette domain-containing protein [Methylomonas koyamae]